MSMNFELRRVAADWSHPRDAEGNHIPLPRPYAEERSMWDIGLEYWRQGLVVSWPRNLKPYGIDALKTHIVVWRYDGPRTDALYADLIAPPPERHLFTPLHPHFPDWPEEKRDAWQLYLDRDGDFLPVTPVFDKLKNMAEWLAKHDESAPGFCRAAEMRGTLTHHNWLRTFAKFEGRATISAVSNDLGSLASWLTYNYKGNIGPDAPSPETRWREIIGSYEYAHRQTLSIRHGTRKLASWLAEHDIFWQGDDQETLARLWHETLTAHDEAFAKDRKTLLDREPLRPTPSPLHPDQPSVWSYIPG